MQKRTLEIVERLLTSCPKYLDPSLYEAPGESYDEALARYRDEMQTAARDLAACPDFGELLEMVQSQNKAPADQQGESESMDMLEEFLKTLGTLEMKQQEAAAVPNPLYRMLQAQLRTQQAGLEQLRISIDCLVEHDSRAPESNEWMTILQALAPYALEGLQDLFSNREKVAQARQSEQEVEEELKKAQEEAFTPAKH